MKVPAKRVTRGKKENRFDQHESGIDPRYLAWWLTTDSVADPRDSGGDEHITVELVVTIMDLNQQVIGINLAGKPREVEIGCCQPSCCMNQIYAGPANGGDRHAGSQRCNRQVQEAADRRGITGRRSEQGSQRR